MVTISAWEFIDEIAFVVGLIGVQVVCSIYAVLFSHLMSIGLNSFFIIIYSSFASAFCLFPLSIYFERHKWPKFGLRLLIRLVVIAFGGVTLFQSLMLTGVRKTSPAIASALPNLAPGLIFIVAATFRLENFDSKCIYSRVKIMGTVLCIVGAVTMSLLHGSHPESSPQSIPSDDIVVDHDKITGFFYLMAAVFVLSCTVVLQSATLGDFPTPISFSAVTSFLGAILTAVAQVILEHKLDSGWPFVNGRDLIGYGILIGVVSGACTSFQAWALKKRGPVIVSMFNPVATICSTILSVVTLGDSITIGSVVGMFFMFTGLYSVLWAKKKESSILIDNEKRKSCDAERPLLS